MAKAAAGATDGKLVGDPKGNGKGPVWPYAEPSAERQQQATAPSVQQATTIQGFLELRARFRGEVNTVIADGRALGMSADDVLDFVRGVQDGLAVLDRVMGRV